MNNEQFTNNKNPLIKYIAFGIATLLFIFALIGTIFLLRAYQQVSLFPQTNVFLEKDLDKTQKETLEKELSGISGLKFNFISQEEALKCYQNFHQEDKLLLKLVKAQMLPAVIELYADNQQSLKRAVEVINREIEVEEVRGQVSLVNQLKQRLKLMMFATGGALTLLFGLLLTLKYLVGGRMGSSRVKGTRKQ